MVELFLLRKTEFEWLIKFPKTKCQYQLAWPLSVDQLINPFKMSDKKCTLAGEEVQFKLIPTDEK